MSQSPTRIVRALVLATVLAFSLVAGVSATHADAAPAPTYVWAKEGTRSEKARDIQLRLITLGYLRAGQADGWYGPVSKAAMIRFQKAVGLPATGIVTQRDFYVLWQKSDAKRRADAANKPRVPAGLDARCMTGRVLCVNKTTRKTHWMINGKIIATYDSRFGRKGMATREGTFRIYWKNKNHVSSIYGSAMPFSMFFSGGQAFHYSSDFARVGYNGASHGCINLRSWSGAQYLFNNVKVGDKVVVFH